MHNRGSNSHSNESNVPVTLYELSLLKFFLLICYSLHGTLTNCNKLNRKEIYFRKIPKDQRKDHIASFKEKTLI